MPNCKLLKCLPSGRWAQFCCLPHVCSTHWWWWDGDQSNALLHGHKGPLEEEHSLSHSYIFTCTCICYKALRSFFSLVYEWCALSCLATWCLVHDRLRSYIVVFSGSLINSNFLDLGRLVHYLENVWISISVQVIEHVRIYHLANSEIICSIFLYTER